MFYRVVVTSKFHEADRPEIAVFYCKTEKSFADFVRELVNDEKFDVNKWYNNHMRDLLIEHCNPQEEFDRQIAAVQLDKTTIDFEGECCEECHDWLYISEYKQEKVYKI